MALTVTDVDQLRAYIAGVMGRADHHAGAVNEIALALAGAILWRKDDQDAIKVMAVNGDTKNVLWVNINSKRYAFSYNHDAGHIEMREGGTHGPTLYTFDNSTPLTDLRKIFESL